MPYSDPRRSRIERERAFFDGTATRAPLEAPASGWVPERTPFENAVLERCGRLRGQRVLELGCGTGELTFRLLDAGAAVTAVDASAASIEVARRRLEQHRPDRSVELLAVPAESTGLAGEQFDLVVGKWVLHHLDVAAAADEIRRLLKPGGRAVFIETSGLNPILRLARSRLPRRLGTRYGTIDEHPLSRDDIAAISKRFASCEVDHPIFTLFYLISRNLFGHRSPRLNRLLRRIDASIGRRAPRLGALSYYLRITLVR